MSRKGSCCSIAETETETATATAAELSRKVVQLCQIIIKCYNELSNIQWQVAETTATTTTIRATTDTNDKWRRTKTTTTTANAKAEEQQLPRPTK